MNVNEMIEKGPVSQEEAASKAIEIRETASPEFSGNVKAETPTKNVLSAFDEVTQKNGAGTDDKIKKLLDEEEKVLAEDDDSEDTKSEGLQKRDEGTKKDVQPAKKEVAEESKKEEVKSLFPQTQKPSIDESLKGIVPDSALPLLKKMSNEAKEFVVSEFKRLGKESSELKSKLEAAEKEKDAAPQGLPPAWYEHEEAVYLTPEYKSISAERNQVSAIENHLRQQLIAIKQGEDWFDLVAGPNGSIQQVKMKASPEADVNVSGRINIAMQSLRELEGKEISLTQSFKSHVAGQKGRISQFEEHYFPMYKDPKVIADSADAKNLQTILQTEGLAKDRLAGAFTKLYMLTMEQVRKVQELESKLSAPRGSKVNPNGPTGDEINTGATGNGKPTDPDDKPFNAKAFDAYIK